MLRLRLSPPCALPDGVYRLRFLGVQAVGEMLRLLFSVESPPYGLWEYTVPVQRDTINGEPAYGGYALESCLKALLGDSAGQDSQETVYLLSTTALVGRECYVVLNDGHPMVWQEAGASP